MLHLQLAGSRFAGIVCNQAGLSQNRLVVTAMMEADYFNVYDFRRRTFPRDPCIPAISADSLVCNRSALVVIQPQERRVCGARPNRVSSVNYLIVLALISDPRVISKARKLSDPLVQWKLNR